jgi:hypothetical protein
MPALNLLLVVRVTVDGLAGVASGVFHSRMHDPYNGSELGVRNSYVSGQLAIMA